MILVNSEEKKKTMTRDDFREEKYNSSHVTTNFLLELKILICLISWSYKKATVSLENERERTNCLERQTAITALISMVYCSRDQILKILTM